MPIHQRAVLAAVAALLVLAPRMHARAQEAGAASNGPASESKEQPTGTGETPTVHRRRPVPLGIGGLLLGTSYIVKIFGGLGLVATSIDGGCGSCAWREAGLLLVPVAGPLLVAHEEDPHGRSSRDWVVFASWSVAEAVAVTLMTVGLVGHDVPLEPARRTPPSATVVPTVTHGLGALSLHVSW